MKFIIERDQLSRMVKHTKGRDDRLRLWACAARVFVESNGVIVGTETLVLEDGTCIVPWNTFYKLVRAYNGQRNVTIEADAKGLRFDKTTLGHLGYTPTAIPPAKFDVFAVSDASWMTESALTSYGLKDAAPVPPSKPQSVPPKPVPPVPSVPPSPPNPPSKPAAVSPPPSTPPVTPPSKPAAVSPPTKEAVVVPSSNPTVQPLKPAVVPPPKINPAPAVKSAPVLSDADKMRLWVVEQEKLVAQQTGVSAPPPGPPSPVADDIEFDCTKCGQHLVVEARGAGMKINCPKCGQELVIPLLGSSGRQTTMQLPENVPLVQRTAAVDQVVEQSRKKEGQPNMKLFQTTSRKVLWSVAVVGVVFGGLLTLLVTWWFLGEQESTAVKRLHAEVTPNNYLTVSLFETKMLGTDEQLIRSGNTKGLKNANLQWRCQVRNVSAIAVHYTLHVDLLDRDGFVLATSVIDSNLRDGDLAPGQSRTVYENIFVELRQVRNLSTCRIKPTALKTDFQLRQEAQYALQKQQEQQEQQRLATIETSRRQREEEEKQRAAATEVYNRKINEQQQQLKNEFEAQRKIQEQALKEQELALAKQRALWRQLRQGMSKLEVEGLLGKPQSIRPGDGFVLGDWWLYLAVNGSFNRPRVEFTPKGMVRGWDGP
jgi:DNA-directed RNA polymerase subunit RPC12/RpoP